MATGFTTWVPPAAGRVNVLPSVPLTVTLLAFVATTVNVDDPPLLMEAGLAAIEIVAAAEDTVIVAAAEAVPPAPVAVAV